MTFDIADDLDRAHLARQRRVAKRGWFKAVDKLERPDGVAPSSHAGEPRSSDGRAA
ncbi:hypothetical protein [Sphingomonas sp. VDB2]|uniref:hypothetical protein n=1 Tax=Sphingomonas sp. VDB2 TaxID=3228751 RepID=UPI003A7FE89D